jgi:hypothetical protein
MVVSLPLTRPPIHKEFGEGGPLTQNAFDTDSCAVSHVALKHFKVKYPLAIIAATMNPGGVWVKRW